MMNKKGSRKICSVDGCNSFVKWRGYCSYHYNTEYLLPKQYNKPRKQPVIARRTPKRIKQEREYHLRRRIFIQDCMDTHPKGKIFCIFCNKEILYLNEISLHHAIGRDDETLLDERYWFLSHNFCHIHMYHSMSCMDIEWWDNYMERIKDINSIVYLKEVTRQNKS